MMRTHSCGLLLWVDDRFCLADPGEVLESPWAGVFGNLSDRVHRLLDLRLKVVASYEAAREALDVLEREVEEAHLFAVVDLTLPRRAGDDPSVKYGIALGRELAARRVPFVFLSANTLAMTHLDRAGLGKVPYYVKERGTSCWRLPAPVALTALAEFRNAISWVTLEEALGAMRSDSDFVATHTCCPEAFRYFPFFGPFRDFVERCEYGFLTDPARTTVLRSARKHCDPFVQQCLCILFYDALVARPGGHCFRYAHAHDTGAVHKLCRTEAAEDPDTVAVLRITPERCSLDQFKALLQETGRRAGTTVFVVPNDETSEPYVEYLRDLRAHSAGDLPQVPPRDAECREELVRRSCSLMFQRWIQRVRDVPAGAVSPAYLGHPELLVNPISWETLLDPERVAEALSDPYEILLEFGKTFGGLDGELRAGVVEAVFRGTPLAYEHLLRVGDDTFLASEYGGRRGEWVEHALDAWLETAWDFPYGIGTRFLRSWARPCEGGAPRPRQCRVAAMGQARCGCEEIKGCGVWEAWQDSAYEILTGILEEYVPPQGEGIVPPSRRTDLERARRFVGALGGRALLADTGRECIDWEALEYLRWPHQCYPLPSAVTRRLRAAGRYLWIQPEGLDLATALPAGRSRYRALNRIAEWYSSVLGWGAEVARELPMGWAEAVEYLVEVISQHRAAEVWRERPGHLWQALLGLLRNGLPVMYLATRLAKGKPVAGKGGTIETALKGVQGYGVILRRLRPTMALFTGRFLRPAAPPTGHSEGDRLLQAALGLMAPDGPRADPARLAEVGHALLALACRVRESPRDPARAVQMVLSDPELRMTDSEGWYFDDGESADGGYGLPGLQGLKADYVWHALEAFGHLESVTLRYRRFDGYHFLACVNDLRVENKDTRPDVPFERVEKVLDLFVSGLETLVAQLAWCVRLAGHPDRAAAIEPGGVRVVPPEPFRPPDPSALSRVLRVVEGGDRWAVYTLGIPGKGSAANLCCHHVNRVVRLDTPRTEPGPREGARRAESPPPSPAAARGTATPTRPA